MTDYLISNDPFDVGGTLDNTAGRYDTDFADHSIFINDNVPHAIKLPEIDTVWVSFDCYMNFRGAEEDGYHWRCFSQDNVVLFQITLANGAASFYSVQSAGSESIPIGIPGAQVIRIDIKFQTNIAANPNQHQTTLYINGAIAAQSQVNGGGGGAPARFEFGGSDAFILADQGYWVSNIRVTDENPVGTKFKVLPPTGAGNYQDFVGNHVELGDFLATTVAYATANLDRVSSTITPGVKPPGTLTKVLLSSTTRSTGPGADPSQIGLFARLAATDYDGALATPAADITSLVEAYNENPNTLAPWDWADLTGLEIGLRAAT